MKFKISRPVTLVDFLFVLSLAMMLYSVYSTSRLVDRIYESAVVLGAFKGDGCANID